MLMADVLRSRSMNPNELLDVLKTITSSINQSYSTAILSPLTITLGDEFQGIFNNLHSTVEVMMVIEEKTLVLDPRFQLRFSVRFDEISTPINEKIAHQMYGPALTLAREELQHLKKSNSRFSIYTGQTEMDHYLNRLFKVLQMLKGQWNSSHYKAIFDFLNGKRDYKELVKKGHYQNESGAWKMVKSQNLEEYLILKELILRTTNWNDS